MTKETIGPEPIDTWQGNVLWIDIERNSFISTLYYPTEAAAVAYIEEVEVANRSLAREQQALLSEFLSFSCTVELDDMSTDGIKEVRDITFLPRVAISREAVARAMEEFGFLANIFTAGED